MTGYLSVTTSLSALANTHISLVFKKAGNDGIGSLLKPPCLSESLLRADAPNGRGVCSQIISLSKPCVTPFAPRCLGSAGSTACPSYVP